MTIFKMISGFPLHEIEVLKTFTLYSFIITAVSDLNGEKLSMVTTACPRPISFDCP